MKTFLYEVANGTLESTSHHTTTTKGRAWEVPVGRDSEQSLLLLKSGYLTQDKKGNSVLSFGPARVHWNPSFRYGPRSFPSKSLPSSRIFYLHLGNPVLDSTQKLLERNCSCKAFMLILSGRLERVSKAPLMRQSGAARHFWQAWISVCHPQRSTALVMMQLTMFVPTFASASWSHGTSAPNFTHTHKVRVIRW